MQNSKLADENSVYFKFLGGGSNNLKPLIYHMTVYLYKNNWEEIDKWTHLSDWKIEIQSHYHSCMKASQRISIFKHLV